jgi:IMP dehydrogenase
LTTALSFDDVLLMPARSGIYSRKNIDLTSWVTNHVRVEVPIISANMPSVTGPKMAIAMAQHGGFGILHRFNTVEEAVKDWKDSYFPGGATPFCGVSLGVGADTYYRLQELYNAGARIFCIDVAHGHHDRVLDMIQYVRQGYNDSVVIAGNVATYDGAFDLAEAGADAIKVGIGPGAACTTREVTGFGVPQVTALIDCSQIKNDFPNVKIIADGGIKNSGDIVKALVFGADTVMLGRLLAGVNESPYPGIYFGNASSRVKDYRAPEGIEGTVEQTGSLEDTLKSLAWGIKSGLSYAGAHSIFDLHENDLKYVRVSPQTMTETRTRI